MKCAMRLIAARLWSVEIVKLVFHEPPPQVSPGFANPGGGKEEREGDTCGGG